MVSIVELRKASYATNKYLPQRLNHVLKDPLATVDDILYAFNDLAREEESITYTQLEVEDAPDSE